MDDVEPRAPATGPGPVAGDEPVRELVRNPGDDVGQISEKSLIPMPLEFGELVNIFLLCDFHRRFVAGDIWITLGLYGPVNPVRKWWTGMWDRCFGMRYALWHTIIRPPGSGVPKAAAAQGIQAAARRAALRSL
jgi:hypothetical protein